MKIFILNIQFIVMLNLPHRQAGISRSLDNLTDAETSSA